MIFIKYLYKEKYTLCITERYLNENNINSISGILSEEFSLGWNISLEDKIKKSKIELNIYEK